MQSYYSSCDNRQYVLKKYEKGYRIPSFWYDNKHSAYRISMSYYPLPWFDFHLLDEYTFMGILRLDLQMTKNSSWKIEIFEVGDKVFEDFTVEETEDKVCF